MEVGDDEWVVRVRRLDQRAHHREHARVDWHLAHSGWKCARGHARHRHRLLTLTAELHERATTTIHLSLGALVCAGGIDTGLLLRYATVVALPVLVYALSGRLALGLSFHAV